MKRVAMLVLLLGLLANSASAVTRLHFINDDYNKARTLATEKQLPLFVEVWAPW